ncbi:MAG: GntR family transcriptional regulator [bacterium]|nr:GntR family transcriptional regulator [bacterium]
MYINIDPSSGYPIYLQIINQIKYSIAMEAIKSGDRLPSVRELASQLRVNPNTVAKAYTELEREGIVFTKRGEGTFVSDTGVSISEEEKEKIIAEMLNRTLVQAYHFNLSANKVKHIFENEIGKIEIL